MRTLVTGAGGFLGSHVVADLLEQGHRVAALVRPGSNAWRLRDMRERVAVIEGSLEDTHALRQPIRAFSPDAIVHMAWSGVGNAERNAAVQAHNVPATVDLASLAASIGVGAFVGAGSHAEYGRYDRAIREDDPPVPTTLYGMAKLAAGTMAAEICAEHGVRFAWLRIFSTYGPRDADHWLIPSLIRNLRAGRRMALTACEQQWGFLHARDAATAFRIVLANVRANGIYNVGNPEAPSLRETVTRLREMVSPTAELGFGEVAYRPDQVMVLKADVGRLAALGWRAEVPLEQGLRETVAWYDAARAT